VASPESSLTVTMRASSAGVIMGTAAFMSTEQARERRWTGVRTSGPRPESAGYCGGVWTERYATSPPNIQPGVGYDVSPDGKRFLMIKTAPAIDLPPHNYSARLVRGIEASGSGR
jgi:hypothetical protein